MKYASLVYLTFCRSCSLLPHAPSINLESLMLLFYSSGRENCEFQIFYFKMSVWPIFEPSLALLRIFCLFCCLLNILSNMRHTHTDKQMKMAFIFSWRVDELNLTQCFKYSLLWNTSYIYILKLTPSKFSHLCINLHNSSSLPKTAFLAKPHFTHNEYKSLPEVSEIQVANYLCEDVLGIS